MNTRGLLSPPRSKFSSKSRRSQSDVASNPPSKPNSSSPCRRPTVAKSTDQLIQKKENRCVKPSIKRTSKDSGIRPPTTGPSSRPNRPSSNPRNNVSKPTRSKVSSGRPSQAPNTKDVHASGKSTDKVSCTVSSRSSSSRILTRNPVRDTALQKTRRPVKEAVTFGSKSDLSSSKTAGTAMAKDNRNPIDSKSSDHRNNPPKLIQRREGQKVLNNENASVGNQNRYSGGLHNSRRDPGVQDQINCMLGCGMEYGNSDRVDNNESRAKTGSDIKKKCSRNDGPKIFQIYRDIASHQQGTLSITSYFTRLKTFWDELASYSDLPLCSCGEMAKLSEHKEREKLMQFLVGLNEHYSTLRGQILLMGPFPTVDKAYALILREEKRMESLMSPEIEAAKLTVYQNDQSTDSNSNDFTLLSNGASKNSGNFNSTHCNVDEVHGTLPHESNNLQKQENQKASDTSLLASTCNCEIEVPSFSHEPLLIDHGSPVRC